MHREMGPHLPVRKRGRNMSRTRRPYTARSVVRIWEYLDRQDRAYIVCWFARIHAQKAQRLSPASIIKGAQLLLGTLGLTGEIASAILTQLDLLRPGDLAECDDLLRRGANE